MQIIADFFSVLHADNVKCYKCTSEDSWCLQEDEMKDKGDEAQTVCESNYCLISGKTAMYIS